MQKLTPNPANALATASVQKMESGHLLAHERISLFGLAFG